MKVHSFTDTDFDILRTKYKNGFSAIFYTVVQQSSSLLYFQKFQQTLVNVNNFRYSECTEASAFKIMSFNKTGFQFTLFQWQPPTVDNAN